MATNDQSIESILAAELESANNTELQQSQATALKYYDAVIGPVAEGMSDLVSPDVREAVESTVAEIMGAIQSNNILATFDPLTPDDFESAKVETEVVHRQIFGKNRGYIILESAIRDALLQRYAVIRVDGGETQVYLQSVAPENFRWSSDLTSPFLSEARFIAERQFITRAELKNIGISKKKAYDAAENEPADTAFLARYDQWNMMQPAARQEDDVISVWWCYLRDNTDSGYICHMYVEPSLVLKSYKVDRHPYATGVTTLRPHRFDGLSLFDKLKQIQATKTMLLRQLELQAKFSSQARLAIRDRSVNPDDLQSDKLNPVIRCKNSPAEDLLPLPIQQVH